MGLADSAAGRFGPGWSGGAWRHAPILLIIGGFTGALLFCVWAALHVQLAQERTEALALAGEANDSLARLVESHVQRTLSAASVILKEVKVTYALRGRALDLSRYFRFDSEDLVPFAAISVLDERGDLVASTVPFTAPQNYAGRPTYRHHLRDPSAELYLSPPVRGVLVARDMVFISSRIERADRSFGGVAVVGLYPAYFSGLYGELRTEPDLEFVLVGRDGIVRAGYSSFGTARQLTGDSLAGAPLMTTHLPAAPDGRFRESAANGGVRLVSYRTVAGYPLVVTVASSEAAALASVEERAGRYTWAAGIASALMIGFAGFAVYHVVREARASTALRMSNERYAAVEEATSDGLWDRNLRTGALYLSRRGRELLGPAAAAGEALVRHLHPDDRAMVRERIGRSEREGGAYRAEYRVRRADGSYRWILSRGKVLVGEDGRPERLVGCVTDITQRREAELRIREQARLLDLIFAHVPDAIVLVDAAFNVVRASRSFARACGGAAAGDRLPALLREELAACGADQDIVRWTAHRVPGGGESGSGATWWDLTRVPILDERGAIEFFLLTLREVTERVRAEAAAARHLAGLRAMSARFVAVQEEERRVLSRELHDEIGQSLTAAKIHLQAIERGCVDCGSAATESLPEALLAVSRVLDQVRSLSLDLRPLHLDDLGLRAALEMLIARTAEAAGWRVRFIENVGSRRFPPAVELTCYRLVQEALTNALRHGNASEVEVSLTRTGPVLLLSVQDNGCGFDAASLTAAADRQHLGLLGMRERVVSLAGEFDLHSAPGQGTGIRARFHVPADPVHEEAA